MDATRSASSPILSPDRQAARKQEKMNRSRGGSPVVPPRSGSSKAKPDVKRQFLAPKQKPSTDILAAMAQYVLDVGEQDGLVDIDGEGSGLNAFETSVVRSKKKSPPFGFSIQHHFRPPPHHFFLVCGWRLPLT